MKYSPFLSCEFFVQSWVDVSRAPLAVTWKEFLLSEEEQLVTNSSTQAMPLIMSLCFEIYIKYRQINQSDQDLLAETVEPHLRGDEAQVVSVQGAGQQLGAEPEVLRGAGRGHQHPMLLSPMVTSIDQCYEAHYEDDRLH